MEVNKKLFKRNLTYEQWLNLNINELLNQMEKESVNNSNFQPLKGA